LKVAPRGNGKSLLLAYVPCRDLTVGIAKWYCDDCKEKLKTKRFNGR